MPHLLMRKAARHAAVGIFVVLAALLLVVWAFTLGLLAETAGYALGALGVGLGGYWSYQHTVDAGWLELDD